METRCGYGVGPEMKYESSVFIATDGKWRVRPWVRDAELESVLNGECAEGYSVYSMFRNSPSESGEETTTVVFVLRQ